MYDGRTSERTRGGENEHWNRCKNRVKCHNLLFVDFQYLFLRNFFFAHLRFQFIGLSLWIRIRCILPSFIDEYTKKWRFFRFSGCRTFEYGCLCTCMSTGSVRNTAMWAQFRGGDWTGKQWYHKKWLPIGLSAFVMLSQWNNILR